MVPTAPSSVPPSVAASAVAANAAMAALRQQQAVREQLARLKAMQAQGPLKKLVLDNYGRELDENGKIIPINHETVPEGLSVSWLRRNIKDDPELLDSFRIYDAAVKELFFRNLELKKEHLKDSPFMGNQVCAGCHTKSTAVWKKSRHSSAFTTLENLGKHFDPECLECHVVGLNPWSTAKNPSESVKKFRGKRGFLSLELTPHLTNVQCES